MELPGSFEKLAVASSLTRLITYILCISALPIIHRQANEEVRQHAYKLKGGYLIPAFALGISVWIAAQSGRDEWLLTGALFAVGLLLFGVARVARGRSQSNA